MFFEKNENIEILEKFIRLYWNQEGKNKILNGHDIHDELFSLLTDSLKIIKEIRNYPKTWDSFVIPETKNLCELVDICDYFNKLSDGSIDLQSRIEFLYQCSLRVLYEVDFKRGSMPVFSEIFYKSELDTLKKNAVHNSKNSTFSANLRRGIEEIVFSVPYDVCKSFFNSEEIKRFSNFDDKIKLATKAINTIENYTGELDEKISGFQSELNEKEKTVNNLKKTLDEQENAFNFVGLYKGFNDLLKKKIHESRVLLGALVSMGIIMITPLMYNINSQSVLGTDIASSLFKLIPFVSLEILLIYFFRIILQNYKSVKGQILQIELRQTLCQFIQKYAEYSKEIRTTDSHPLEKFENLIFSGIISDSENLPSTFDGMDQITKLLTSLKGK